MKAFGKDETEYCGERFEKLNLVASEFRDISFYDCEFVSCNFSDTAFIGCKFDNCTLSGCNLSMARITGSVFREVAFLSSKLVGIDWTTARWPSVPLSGLVGFEECILNGSSFFGLYLQELKMEACQAQEVDFTEADCAYASFIQTDFAGAVFHQTNLSKSDFSDATNYGINVETNKVAGAKFSLPEAISLLRGLGIEIVD